MTTFIIIGIAINFFLSGALVGALIVKHKFLIPQRELTREAIKGWKDAIQIAMDIASSKGELTPIIEEKPAKKKKREKMILSPLQVKRFGQPD